MALYLLDGKSPQTCGDDFWVAPNATVLGNVRLHRDASVWFGAVLRGDNDPIIIGEGSNIQDGAVCHTDLGYPLILGKGITVGHRAVLHGCTVGDYCLVGIGAVVLNGARIGAESLIGAGALVLENTEIPPRSLVVGSPAKVVRELTEEAVRALHASAQVYIDNARRFRNGLEESPVGQNGAGG